MASEHVHGILSRLTLEEKISLLAGGGWWETLPIPSKGVPSVKMSDGPNGARGANFRNGTTSACFPAACSVASTFSTSIAHRVGEALGEETKRKGARCILAPTMCIHRHPLGGRNFESYSEDPFLSGKLAAATVRGIESTSISATIKHFVANEQETQRLTVNVNVSERALREVYLKPFEFAIKQGDPGAVMTSYNLINGSHADSSEYLLREVLRGDWNWDGLVMSDWGGTNSVTESIRAGMDLEMPGPAHWRQVPEVLNATDTGLLTEEAVTKSALRVLRFLERQRCFENPEIPDEVSEDRPEIRALIRETGAKGMVLLKNEGGVLPLTVDKVRGKKVALLGYAQTALIHGGGSASVNAHYRVSPMQGLQEAFGDQVELTYAKGAHTFRQLPLIQDNVFDAAGNSGFTYNIYNKDGRTLGETFHGYESEIALFDYVDEQKLGSLAEGRWTFELIGTFVPPETGTYYATLSGIGPSTLFIDNSVVYDQPENCRDFMGYLFGAVPVPRLEIQLEAGKSYDIRVVTRLPLPSDGIDLGIYTWRFAVRLGCMPKSAYEYDVLAEAVALARGADYAIVFTGHEPEWESEGQDRPSFHLPREGSLDRLVSAVAAENGNTIVVNSTGAAIALPWLENVKALVQAWFPGQEAGRSIADVLTGTITPEGHLPCTFPKTLEDCPAYGNFPGDYVQNRLEVNYEEGVFVGYRHFDRLPAEKVHFPFGFGLSYTTFSYTNLVVTGSSDFDVTATVSNTGDFGGATAVQVYVGHHTVKSTDPIKVLAGFSKVALDPGSSVIAKVAVSARDFAFWDEPTRQWVVEPGKYLFSVGKSAADLVLSAVVEVAGQRFSP